MLRNRKRLVCLLSVGCAILIIGCFPKSPGTSLAHFPEEAPRVGEEAPAFSLRDVEGGEVVLTDLVGDKPIVVQLGSHSCPVYRYRRHTMDNLWEDYAESVLFLVVYTREAHPVGSKSPYSEGEWDPMINKLTGVRVREPADFEARLRLASESKEDLGLPVQVLVDDMGDGAWRDYGRASSPAFVIDREGRIALSQVWLEPKEIRRTLERLLGRAE